MDVIGIGPTIIRPGAQISGFQNPSCVRPYADHGARSSSVVLAVPPMSTAPTVITNGLLPGANSTPLGDPSLP